MLTHSIAADRVTLIHNKLIPSNNELKRSCFHLNILLHRAQGAHCRDSVIDQATHSIAAGTNIPSKKYLKINFVESNDVVIWFYS